MSEKEKPQNIFSEFMSLLFDGRIPLLSKLLFVGVAGIYTISPLDVFPDILLPLGIVDDGSAIVALAYFFIQYGRQRLERIRSGEVNAGGNIGCISIGLGCFGLVGITVAIATIGFVMSLLWGIFTITDAFSSIGEYLGQPATAQVTSTRTIVNSIQPLGQLVSVSVEVAQADINVAIDSGGLNLCNHNANHVSQGAVEAGVDINQVEDDDIDYDEASDTYTITLPAAMITSCRIEYIRQYERSGSNPTCGYDWDNVRLLANYHSTVMFAEQTLEAGILSRAEREASLSLEAFIGALTGSNIEIVFEEIEGDPVLPPSCTPQLPNGWTFDEELNAWVEAN